MHFNHTPPDFAVPAGACDCHMHVFGPAERFPFAPVRSYTPPPATVADYLRLTGLLGIDRNVFVQGSAHGTDNSGLVAALTERGDAARGVAVIGPETSAAELARLTKAGVRGARVNMATFGVRDSAVALRELSQTVDRIAEHGWHVQLFAHLETISALKDQLAALKVPLVLDHMGLPKASLGTGQPGFDDLLELLAGGTWVKLSGAYRVSDAAPEHKDAGPIARALIATNPDRLVWGTDWPHTGQHANARLGAAPFTGFRPLDDGALMTMLADWTDRDAGLLQRILVDNPARLYGFA